MLTIKGECLGIRPFLWGKLYGAVLFSVYVFHLFHECVTQMKQVKHFFDLNI
jgi:hypothetical protein